MEVVKVLEEWLNVKAESCSLHQLRNITVKFTEGAEKKILSLQSFFALLNKLTVKLDIDIFVSDDESLHNLQQILQSSLFLNRLLLKVSERASYSTEAANDFVEMFKRHHENSKLRVDVKNAEQRTKLLEDLVMISKNPTTSLEVESPTTCIECLKRFQRKIEKLSVYCVRDGSEDCFTLLPVVKVATVKIVTENLKEFFLSVPSREVLNRIDFELLSSETRRRVFQLLPEILEEFPRVYDIKIVRKALRDIDEIGKKLHETFLAPAIRERLKFLIQNGEVGDYKRGKIMVLGQGGAGKTSTLRSISGQDFVSSHEKTLVADKVNIIETDGKGFGLLGEKEEGFIGDLAAISAEVFRNPEASRNTEELDLRKLEVVPEIILERRVPTSLSEEMPKASTTMTEIKDLEQTNEVSFRVLKNSLKFSWWDFGGQRVFDAIHSLYLSDGGILLYVFNLKRLLEDEDKTIEKISKWLVSIQLYSKNCQLLFIGTHAGDYEVQDNIQDASEVIEDLQNNFKEINYVYPGKKLSFFPVENSEKNDLYLEAVKKEIRRVSTDVKLKMTWTQKVELSWMFFMHTVYSGDTNVISFFELFEEANRAGFSTEEARRMIDFFSSAGEILNFRKSVEDDTKASIVMKPKWLLKVLATILCCRDKRFKDILREIGREASDGSGQLIKLLKKSGIIGERLLRNLLIRECQITKDEFELVVRVCERKLIMARIEDVPKELGLKKRSLRVEDRFWMLPSFFVREEDESEKKYQEKVFLVETIHESSRSVMMRRVEWSGVAPHSLFGKFICGVINAGRKVSKSYFKIVSLSGESLGCTLDYQKFEVLFENASLYSLKLYSKDLHFVQEVTGILKEAYRSIQLLEVIGDKVEEEDCEFFTENARILSEEFGENKNEHQMEWDVFLSHTWANDNHRRVVEIGRRLQEKGVKVWLDEDNMKASIATSMLKGINKSYVFLAFITKEYLEAANNPNSNAGKEMNFAASINTEYIIPILLEPKLANPSTWNKSVVKLHLPQVLYVDFSSVENIEANLGSLLERIHEIKKLRLQQSQSS